MKELLYQGLSMVMQFGVPIVVALICKMWVSDLVAKNKNTATNIALVADRLTDEACLLYPNSSYALLFNTIVDEMIKSCNIDKEIANREAAYQLRIRNINPEVNK